VLWWDSNNVAFPGLQIKAVSPRELRRYGMAFPFIVAPLEIDRGALSMLFFFLLLRVFLEAVESLALCFLFLEHYGAIEDSGAMEVPS